MNISDEGYRSTNNKELSNRWRTDRRLVLGGLAGGLSAALLGGACSHSEESGGESVSSAPPPAPESIPPGASPLDAERLAEATQLLRDFVSIDLHCHPGMFFFEGMTPEDPAILAMSKTGGFAARTIGDMTAGQLTTGIFATVADLPLLGAANGGLYARREFEQGEAYADHQRQFRLLQQMVDNDLVAPIRSPEDIATAKEKGTVGAIFATEGGDFLEQKGERIEEAYDAGIRAIGLVHYHVNDIGDIQTAPSVHNGLTAFGKEAVREMNRLGIMIDLAHATFETCRDVAELTAKPVLISHSFVADAAIQHPRLLTEEHARIIARTGGIVGAWPSGIGNPDFSSFVDRLFHLVDVIGIDHVALGTDMDANFKPVFTNYRQLPQLPAALLERGMTDEEVAKVLGGNFLRSFDEVSVVA